MIRALCTGHIRLSMGYIPEPVFVNVYGAQESILPGWEAIPGLLKRFLQIRALVDSMAFEMLAKLRKLSWIYSTSGTVLYTSGLNHIMNCT